MLRLIFFGVVILSCIIQITDGKSLQEVRKNLIKKTKLFFGS
jgi:hypothetical protein